MGLPVFKVTPVSGEGKVKNLLLPFRGNIEKDSENKWSQQDVNGPPDCILAVSDDGTAETEVVSTDPVSTGEGDAICLQCINTVFKVTYLVKTIWVKSVYWHQ